MTSPEDEPALYWFDCLTGDQHGFDHAGMPSMIAAVEGRGPAYEPPPLREEDCELITEYCERLGEFVAQYGCSPQWRGVDDSGNNSMEVDVGDGNVTFAQTSSGLFVPVGEALSKQLPEKHPWKAISLYEEEPKEWVRRNVRADQPTQGNRSQYKAPVSIRVSRNSPRS